MRIELGNGQYADVKEVDELRDGDRVAVNASFSLSVDPANPKNITVPGSRNDSMRRALLCRIITGWNLQWPLPEKRPDSLDKLTLAQVKALYKGTQEHFDLVTEKDGEEDGAVPTETASSPS